MQKQEIISLFMEHDVLISPDIIENLQELNKEEILEKIKNKDFLILNKDTEGMLDKKDILWKEIDKSHAITEQSGKITNIRLPEEAPKKKQDKKGVDVTFSYDGESKKRELSDFVNFFNARYKSMEKLLSNRMEINNLTSISRIKNKKDRDTISLIAMVSSIQTTKNNNIILTVEDPTDSIKVLINKNKPDLFKEAQDIVPDEVIAIIGVNGDNIVFANNVLWPEIPLTKELKKCKDEVYAVFLSDLHVGSNNFLSKDFQSFIKWINGELGTDSQKATVSKIRYMVIAGDLVDGCGIYPGQDEELDIKDIYEQYKACAGLLAQIPKEIQIIICPGNHDAMRIAEPQPALYQDFAQPIYDLPNVTIVSNPSQVKLHKSEDFPGFDVLIYHGYSFDYYVANVDSIRNSGGYDRSDLIMKFLLRRRHLAPTHTSTLYLPENQDNLIIDTVPDIFITGHTHKSIAANYRNITLISGSCWQSKTSFQEKVGHNPEPSRVPIINLQTRKVKILRFGANG